MGLGRRYKIKKKDNNPFSFISNNAIDSFGFIKIYETIQVNAIKLRRVSDGGLKDIPWDGNKINKNEILNFADLSGNDSVQNLYGQKNPSSDLSINARNIGNQLFIGSVFDFYQFAISANRQYRIEGSLSNSLIRNRPFLAFTFLYKNTQTNKIFFYISSSLGLTNTWVQIQTTTNGYNIAGRRLNSDSYQNISTSGTIDITQWQVITGIFNFQDRELILRVNGVENNKITNFGSGGNSNDTNPTSIIFLGNRDQDNFGDLGSLAAATFWNTIVSTSEIQAIEDYYMNIKELLP
jgi:hypothetical protein